MGFYVDLEMPKDCPMCPFAHYNIFNTFCGCDIIRGKRWAMKNDKDYAESSTRPDWCPLIEIPEPHGRLGDLDDIIKRAKKWIDHPDKYISQRNKDMIYILEREDAIIPASEEE